MAKASVTKIGPVVGEAKRVVKFWVESMPCKLNEEELWDAASRACEMTCDIARLEEQKKFAMGEFKAKIKAASLAREIEARSVVTGEVAREVRVEEIYDSIENTVFRVRADDGTVLCKRSATQAERQDSLEFGGSE